MYEIEDGIVPVAVKGHGRSTKYPFNSMEIGQSIFVPYAGEDPKKKTRSHFHKREQS